MGIALLVGCGGSAQTHQPATTDGDDGAGVASIGGSNSAMVAGQSAGGSDSGVATAGGTGGGVATTGGGGANGGGAMTGGVSTIGGGGAVGSAGVAPTVAPDCDPSGTWTVSATRDDTTKPQTLVVSGSSATAWTADLGKTPPPNQCAGSPDGTFGGYRIEATLSGPCQLRVAEFSSFTICGEGYTQESVTELTIDGARGVGTRSDSHRCLCELQAQTTTVAIEAVRTTP